MGGVDEDPEADTLWCVFGGGQVIACVVLAGANLSNQGCGHPNHG